MIGFLIGAVCLVGLIKVLRYGRGCGGNRGWGGRGRWGGGGCGSSGWGGYEGHHHDRGGFGRHGGPRIFLRMLFERLDTTPGQEKVIAGTLEQLYERKRALAEEFVNTRRDVARAMRGDRFDEVALGEAFTRQDALLAELRIQVGDAMKTVHEALDERQRKIAADLLEGGGGGYGRFGGSPYRHGWA